MGKRGHKLDLDWRHDAEEQLGEGSLADGHAGRVTVEQPFNRHKAYRRNGRDVSMEHAAKQWELPSDDAGY